MRQPSSCKTSQPRQKVTRMVSIFGIALVHLDANTSEILAIHIQRLQQATLWRFVKPKSYSFPEEWHLEAQVPSLTDKTRMIAISQSQVREYGHKHVIWKCIPTSFQHFRGVRTFHTWNRKCHILSVFVHTKGVAIWHFKLVIMPELWSLEHFLLSKPRGIKSDPTADNASHTASALSRVLGFRLSAHIITAGVNGPGKCKEKRSKCTAYETQDQTIC